MNFKYNWKNNAVIFFLNKIYYNTYRWLVENDYDVSHAEELLISLEDFIYYMESHGYSANLIISKLSDIEHIEFFESLYITNNNSESNLDELPNVINTGTRILLNSNLASDARLSSKERRRLYLYKGLAKSIFSLQSEKTFAFNKIYSEILDNESSRTATIVNNGWLLLEDILSQELAEKVTYATLERIRPGYRIGLENEKIGLSGALVSSNLECERAFQAVLVDFGLTISKIGTCLEYNKGIVISSLLNYGIKEKLSDIIIIEYIENGNILELYELLYLMGLLQNEKLKQYHISFIPNLELDEKEINKVYQNIFELTKRMINFDNKEYHEIPLFIDLSLDTKSKVLKLIHNLDIE